MATTAPPSKPFKTRSSSTELRIRVPDFLSVVHFSRGTLPQQRGEKGTTGPRKGEPFADFRAGGGVDRQTLVLKDVHFARATCARWANTCGSHFVPALCPLSVGRPSKYRRFVDCHFRGVERESESDSERERERETDTEKGKSKKRENFMLRCSYIYIYIHIMYLSETARLLCRTSLATGDPQGTTPSFWTARILGLLNRSKSDPSGVGTVRWQKLREEHAQEPEPGAKILGKVPLPGSQELKIGCPLDQWMAIITKFTRGLASQSISQPN